MSVKSDRKRIIKEGSVRLLGHQSASSAHAARQCLQHCIYCARDRQKPVVAVGAHPVHPAVGPIIGMYSALSMAGVQLEEKRPG